MFAWTFSTYSTMWCLLSWTAAYHCGASSISNWSVGRAADAPDGAVEPAGGAVASAVVVAFPTARIRRARSTPALRQSCEVIALRR